jgi:hypothetical protein
MRLKSGFTTPIRDCRIKTTPEVKTPGVKCNRSMVETRDKGNTGNMNKRMFF